MRKACARALRKGCARPLACKKCLRMDYRKIMFCLCKKQERRKLQFDVKICLFGAFFNTWNTLLLPDIAKKKQVWGKNLAQTLAQVRKGGVQGAQAPWPKKRKI